jgi:hypothetical protein
MNIAPTRVVLSCTLLLAAACDAPVTSPDTHSPAANLVAQFNPQPDPPGRQLGIQLAGRFETGFSGRYAEGLRSGALTVETLSTAHRNGTVYLKQRWTIYPPDPFNPVDPIHPPEPVRPVVMELQGSLVGNRLVLLGSTAGGRAQLQANVVTGSGGMSIGGELMFNPQPEPPGR